MTVSHTCTEAAIPGASLPASLPLGTGMYECREGAGCPKRSSPARRSRHPCLLRRTYIPVGKKNPPCGGLKTLFSVGGAFTTTVHDKIFSEIVPDVHSLFENHVTVHCVSTSANAIGDRGEIFRNEVASATHADCILLFDCKYYLFSKAPCCRSQALAPVAVMMHHTANKAPGKAVCGEKCARASATPRPAFCIPISIASVKRC